MNSTLIGPEQNWLIWAILFVAAIFGLWAERTKIGSKLSAVVVTILTTFTLSNLNIIPISSEAYNIVWSYLVPLAIPLLLFKANLKKIFKEAGPTLIAFFIGGLGTIAGTLIAFFLIDLGDEGWKIAGIFCSTYIGGSLNFVASAEALGLKSGDYLTAGIAADNLVMTVYFILLFAIPSMKFFTKKLKFKINPDVNLNKKTAIYNDDNTNLFDMTKSIAISFSICAIGYLLADFIKVDGSGILIITSIIVILATSFPKKFGEIKGANQLGTMLMQVFFGVIGASANINAVIKVGPILFIFAATILLIHLITLIIIGKVLKLNLAEIVIASNSNMGGPTTAAAMAVAKKWDNLVIPAILCGTLGYAIATFVGVGIGHWLH